VILADGGCLEEQVPLFRLRGILCGQPECGEQEEGARAGSNTHNLLISRRIA
jgi:hypothetical protein